jgi:glutaredoxin
MYRKHFAIFYKDGCPYCVKARGLLAEYAIQNSECQIKEFPKGNTKEEYKIYRMCINECDSSKKVPRYEKATVPQIFYVENETTQYVGGSDKLFEFLKALDAKKNGI